MAAPILPTGNICLLLRWTLRSRKETTYNTGLSSFPYKQGRRGRHKIIIQVAPSGLDASLQISYSKTHLIYSGKLHLAPIIDTPQNILDLGTGTGIWAVDMADKYESASVIGVDIAPCQTTFVPPNCQFEVEDVETDWLWPIDHFDHSKSLVHMYLLHLLYVQKLVSLISRSPSHQLTLLGLLPFATGSTERATQVPHQLQFPRSCSSRLMLTNGISPRPRTDVRNPGLAQANRPILQTPKTRRVLGGCRHRPPNVI